MNRFGLSLLRACREERPRFYGNTYNRRRGYDERTRSYRRHELVVLMSGIGRRSVPYVTAPSVNAGLSRISYGHGKAVTPTKAERAWLSQLKPVSA